jgi:hypothetical protein
MVHKATDAIPCIQDRTDFCYCCGLEVTPDYPHYEAINPNVNHFPDGVYNDCRVVLEGFSVAIQNKPSTQRRHGRRNTTANAAGGRAPAGGRRGSAAAVGRRAGGADPDGRAGRGGARPRPNIVVPIDVEPTTLGGTEGVDAVNRAAALRDRNEERDQRPAGPQRRVGGHQNRRHSTGNTPTAAGSRLRHNSGPRNHQPH